MFIYSVVQTDTALHGLNSEAVILSLQAGGGKVSYAEFLM
jgi:hypothetical protein